jgi:anti-sigma B factor antagonist
MEGVASEFSVTVETSEDGCSHVVRVCGEIDYATVPALRDFLTALGGNVAVDCEGVSFMDSTGLGMFVAYQRALAVRGGTVRLTNVGPGCYRLLELTGLLDVLGVEHQKDAS